MCVGVYVLWWIGKREACHVKVTDVEGKKKNELVAVRLWSALFSLYLSIFLKESKRQHQRAWGEEARHRAYL